MELEIQGGHTITDKESDHLTLEQLNIQDEAEIKVSQKRRQRFGGMFDRSRLAPGVCDIGVFDENHA